MSEKQADNEQQERAERKLNAILNVQKREEERLIEAGNEEDLEYYFVVSHRDYEDLIKLESEDNPLIWELYIEHKKNNPDSLELAKYRAGKKYNKGEKRLLDAREYQKRTQGNLLNTILSANDDKYR